MTFTRRMTLQTAGLTLSIVLLGVASLWGLSTMRRSLRAAEDEYRELQMVRETGIHIAAAREFLLNRDSGGRAAVQAIDRAIEELDSFISFQNVHAQGGADHERRERVNAVQSREDLAGIRRMLAAPSPATPASASLDPVAVLDKTLSTLSNLARDMDRVIASAQADSSDRLRKSLILIGLLAVGVVSLATVLSILQYRGVMGPLRQLREGVRRIAGGNFRGQIQLAGTAEFSDLAAEFNNMARELSSLYTELERKVQARSRELVRSERLASVGFLAAGVAHEINNPLNIITGYAELSVRQAECLPPGQAAEDIRQAFQIIREEGFRCKSITEKLVSLARSSNRCREPVHIGRIAQDVVTLVQGLRQSRLSPVHLAITSGDPLIVWGNENELRQVVLSLVVNALQAVSPAAGEVLVQGVRHDNEMELSVTDNGCGMSPEVLEHVFEPFFSERWPDGERGIGLGLSITHAIVEAHGGRITAESGGPGLGSKFTVRFPTHRDAQAQDGKAA